MIRILQCPRCAKKLRLDDSKGLQAGMCPGCGQKFRVPKPKSDGAQLARPAPPIAAPRAEHAPPQPAAHFRQPVQARAEYQPPPPPASLPPPELAIPEADILPLDDAIQPGQPMPADGGGYAVAGGAPRPVESIPEAQVVDDFYDKLLEDTGYGPAGGKRRKKKKRKRASEGMSLETGNLIISAAAMGVFWLFTLLILFIWPHANPIIMAFGAAIFAVGQSWYVRSVMEDGVETALMVMFVPIYPLIYFIGNMDRLGKPYAVRMAGLLIFLSAFVVYLANPKSPDDEEDPANRSRPYTRYPQPIPPPAQQAPPTPVEPDPDDR